MLRPAELERHRACLARQRELEDAPIGQALESPEGTIWYKIFGSEYEWWCLCEGANKPNAIDERLHGCDPYPDIAVGVSSSVLAADDQIKWLPMLDWPEKLVTMYAEAKPGYYYFDL